MEIPGILEQVTKSPPIINLSNPTDNVSSEISASHNLRFDVTEGPREEVESLTTIDRVDSNSIGKPISLTPNPLISVSNPIILGESNPNYPSGHNVGNPTEDVTDTPNLRSWKRIVRNRGGADQSMQADSLGKRVNRDEDDDHLELPSKRLQVSKRAEDNSNPLVEAVSQPRHLQ